MNGPYGLTRRRRRRFNPTASARPDQPTVGTSTAWYGKDKPTLASITFRPADDKELVELLRDKQIDGFTARPDTDMVAGLANMTGINYELTPSFSWEQLQFNTTNTFLRDPKLREAIMDVINVQEIIDRTVGAVGCCLRTRADAADRLPLPSPIKIVCRWIRRGGAAS